MKNVRFFKNEKSCSAALCTIAFAAISGVLFSCAKEELDYNKLNLIGNPKPITVNASLPKSAGVDKTLVDGEGKVKWEPNDKIVVNGSTLPIKRLITDTLAEFQGSVGSLPTPAGEGYWATYPDVLSPRGYNASSVTVSLPATQTYNGDLIPNYMVAFNTANGACLDLKFRNMCSIVKIPVQTFSNVTGEEAVLHSIDVEVISPSGKYLAGEASVTWNSDQSPKLSFSNESNRSSSVTLNCNDIDVHSQKTFSIMLPAQQNCTFKVTFHHGKCLVTEKTISNASLVRNTIYTTSAVTLDTIVPGGFSVSPTKKVSFAPGNLQYQASSHTWRFAPNAYDYIGEAPGNNTTMTAHRATQSQWIDLFGWGTSGDTTTRMPYSYDYHDFYYIDGTNNIAGTNYDWGVRNAIFNPSTGNTDPARTWRTPTTEEWNYIINTRGGNCWWRYNIVTCSGYVGLIIYPDGTMYQPEGLSCTLHQNSATNVDIALSDYQKLMAIGCVFLPAGGNYDNKIENKQEKWEFTNVNNFGVYWSSTYEGAYPLQTGYKAYCFAFAKSLGSTTGTVLGQYTNFVHFGCSVRLVKDMN